MLSVFFWDSMTVTVSSYLMLVNSFLVPHCKQGKGHSFSAFGPAGKGHLVRQEKHLGKCGGQG